MTCDQVKESIADYLAGSLSQSEAEEMDEHFARCAACQQESAALSQTWEMLGLLEAEQPGGAVRARFYASLEAYRQGLASAEPTQPRRRFWDWGARGFQVAWSAAVLAIGIGLGVWVGAREHNRADLARLQDDVQHMRQLVTLSLLQEQSASERLRGVEYADRVAQSDTQVLNALLRAVNHDPNVNVRLAAVDALRKFAGNPTVRHTLNGSLVRQASPLVQIALIDYMVDARDKGAAPALTVLEKSPTADRNVKEKALWGLSQLQ